MVATEAAPATYNNFARADIQWRIAAMFARAHDNAQARKVALAIEKEGHRNAALREIIEIQAKGQDYDGALQTALLGTSEDPLTDYALNRIAERQVIVETLDKVITTIAKIKSDEARCWALAFVAEDAGEAGRIADALTLVQVRRLAVAESPVSCDAYFFQRALTGVLRKIALSRADHGALQVQPAVRCV